MLELFNILKVSMSALKEVFMDPLFLVVVLVVYFQYRRLERMEVSFFDRPVTPLREKLAFSLGFGILGGVIGTAVASLLGITVSVDDFTFIWPLAIFLMMVRTRYICFSYAGGLVSLLSLTVGWPKINVPSIMAVIAILHMVESLLIYLDGNRFPTPIMARMENGRFSGGFYLQKFWPIPLIVIVAAAGRTTPVETGGLPVWWPAFLASGESLQTVFLQLTGLVAVLGYGDMTLSRTPSQKTRIAAGRLLLFSLALLGLSLLATRWTFFAFAAALFSPLAHEGLILYSRKEERERSPLLSADAAGLAVLAVFRQGPGKAMKLVPGDRIVRANNRPVVVREDLEEVLAQRPSFVWLDVEAADGSVRTVEHRDYQSGVGDLGCLFVDRHPRRIYVAGEKEDSRFSRLWKRMRNRAGM